MLQNVGRNYDRQYAHPTANSLSETVLLSQAVFDLDDAGIEGLVGH